MRRPRGEAGALVVVRGSRFLAWLAPAADVGAAEAVLRVRTDAHPDATHHCWAYRVWRDGRVDAAGFDAGEPSGTGGRPILGALERADLVQAACVVSRWFGGTRLGTGGLTRAYAESAAAAIEVAGHESLLEPVEVCARFDLRFGYDRTGAVRAVVARFHARELAAGYGAEVELTLAVPREDSAAFAAAVGEAGGGEVRLERRADILTGWSGGRE